MDHATMTGNPDNRSPRAEAMGANFSNPSAIELAAKRGIGPLSALGQMVWHGETRPCVSCGQLIRRTSAQCDQCGQLLTGDMIQRMRQYSGPWYVLEHVRPFPGVSKERLIKQIKRGVLTHTTIVRGPTTHHQWRYAGETPGLSKHLGVCWACQAHAQDDDSICTVCRKNLDSDGEEALIEGDETLIPESKELDRLKAAVTAVSARHSVTDGPARIGPVRASWLITVVVLLLMVGVYWAVSLREGGLERPASKRPTSAPRLAPDWSPTSAPSPQAGSNRKDPAGEKPADAVQNTGRD